MSPHTYFSVARRRSSQYGQNVADVAALQLKYFSPSHSIGLVYNLSIRTSFNTPYIQWLRELTHRNRSILAL
jgi:hypothetical protein